MATWNVHAAGDPGRLAKAGLTGPGPWSRLVRSALAPPLFAGLAILVHLAAVWPVLTANHRDVSVFVQAGHRFVDTARLEAPIKVTAPVGYDGQFYYRMAVAPLSFRPVDGGIEFDAPSYRSQRFLFPLLAWLAALGRPALAAASLFGVNLVGIGAIAWLSLLLTRALRITPVAALAIALWPGFLVALTHDTSEIVSEAFLVGALLCYASRRLAGYAVLGIAATMTRETTAIVFAGMLLADAVACLLRGGPRRAPLAGLLLLIPIVVWHEALPVLWHETSPEGVVAHDFGWPLVGVANVLGERLAALHGWTSMPVRRLTPALLNLLITVALLGFCACVASRVPACLRRGGAAAALAVGWILVAALMSMLSAGDGPWVTPTEYCRAFSECWVVGCVLLCAGTPSWIERRRWLPLAGFSAGFWVAVLLFERWSFGLSLRF